MILKPKIVELSEKKLVGLDVRMSLINNKTGQLWSGFGPKIKDITNRISNDKISMQIYGNDFISNFTQETEFTKWAAVEVEDFDNCPDELNTFVLSAGLYAVFHYQGSSSDNTVFQYIFHQWLPTSSYVLDNRPHFEVLGEKYRNNDVKSEEEIWIPIARK